MRKKERAVVLTMAMVLTMGIPVIQGEASALSVTGQEQIEQITPAYEIGADIATSFTITNHKANLKLVVGAPSSIKVAMTMILQRKDGNSWTKVQTWNKTGTGNQSLSKSMVVTDGRKYRMKYKVTVGSETVTDKTAAKTA